MILEGTSSPLKQDLEVSADLEKDTHSSPAAQTAELLLLGPLECFKLSKVNHIAGGIPIQQLLS